jgi:Bromodomain extra-terminal - transcription regulation/Bromodomain
MLDSEHSGTKSEDEKEAVDKSSNNKLNENKKNKLAEDVGQLGTPSLSSTSPGKTGGENGAAEKDEDVNTTKSNGAKDNNKTSNGSEEAMDLDNGKNAIKDNEEEDVEMEDADTEKSNKNHKNNTDNNNNGKDKDKPTSKQQSASVEEKKVDGDKSKSGSAAGGDASSSSKSNGAAPAAAAPNPPPPVLKGTLSYNLDLRRHLIRGMWNYENSGSNLAPQRFELLRTLEKDEDPKELPKDGVFHGSFSLAYFHTTSKGKQKERSKVIPETGVKIVFTKIEGKDDEYKVDGKGTNQFGIFHINGTATPSKYEGDPVYDVILRKRYEPSPEPPTRAEGDGTTKKRKSMDGGETADFLPLPPPSKHHATGVVCLRGNLAKEEPADLGGTDVVQRITGLWSSGLDLILADPQNENGHCNKFEYEHKSAVPTNTFPVSGRYSGWFHLTTPEGKRTTISERDVNLRFIKNSEGYHNVEGRGSNAFGKYTISGTLSKDNVLTIFRHFKPLKIKASKAPAVTSAPPPINKGSSSSRRPQHTFPEPLMKLEEVIVPGEEDGEPLAPIQPPDNTTYSAVSQGVLRLNEDGSHQCTGKWAVTREHFTSGQTSQFNFRLEPHYALEAVNEKKKQEGIKVEETPPTGTPVIPQDFPLDSALYKGSFQLKKKGTRYDTIVDQQIVMKFRKSTSGAYNVYGTGVNNIGVFNLIGTMIMRGKASGQVELYRMYPPALLNKAKPKEVPVGSMPGKVPVFPKSEPVAVAAPIPEPTMPISSGSSTIMPPRAGLVRRESTRLVKLPSRLEDDDPKAQLARIMEKCVVILRHIREKDVERGAFFSEPVDPVALGIPNYRQIITEPMDLGTVARKLEGNQIDTPEEFARLVRLTFENAITFNVDPNHSVHQVARFLLIEFNKKYRDIERILETLRRAHKGADLDDKGKKKKKDEKKRKRGPDEPKSLKRRRLDEAQAMAADNQKAMASIVAAAPQGVPNAPVSRGEFNMMIHMIQLLQKQIVQTHNALAELSPGDDGDESTATVTASTAAPVTPAFDPVASLAKPASAPAPPERKKSKKKSTEPAPKKPTPAPAPAPVPVVEEQAIIFDESKPLTLQEQETLTETINNMPADHIPGVIQIIRESASLNGDEDEIDLEIDQLDTVTQRKLLRHVSKVRRLINFANLITRWTGLIILLWPKCR